MFDENDSYAYFQQAGKTQNKQLNKILLSKYIIQFVSSFSETLHKYLFEKVEPLKSSQIRQA